MAEGLLDTNIFLHAQARDAHSGECRAFLAALERGTTRARLEPIVLHELSYALRHYLKQLTRTGVADYLITILSWEGVQGEKDLMADAVERWRTTPGMVFVDAFLAARAHELGCPIYTKNVKDFVRQGVDVPPVLP